MKSSVHLFYGIIIGILLVACIGQTTSETTSSTESIKQDKKEFTPEDYLQLVKDSMNKVGKEEWEQEDKAEFKEEKAEFKEEKILRVEIHSSDSDADFDKGSVYRNNLIKKIKKNGYTIIDWEIDFRGGNHFLHIGK